MSLEPEALLILAKTVYGEARGEAWLGRIAVAWVVRNRAESPGWWGVDIVSCCLHPFAFSCWLPRDPNRALLDQLNTRDFPPFRGCLAAAAAVLCDLEEDPTHGADHYLNLSALDRPPRWYQLPKVTANIGNHTFLRLG